MSRWATARAIATRTTKAGTRSGETYLPDELAGRRYYEPRASGYEAKLRDHLERLRKSKAREE